MAILVATLGSGTAGHVPPWTSLEAGMYNLLTLTVQLDQEEESRPFEKDYE